MTKSTGEGGRRVGDLDNDDDEQQQPDVEQQQQPQSPPHKGHHHTGHHTFASMLHRAEHAGKHDGEDEDAGDNGGDAEIRSAFVRMLRQRNELIEQAEAVEDGARIEFLAQASQAQLALAQELEQDVRAFIAESATAFDALQDANDELDVADQISAVEFLGARKLDIQHKAHALDDVHLQLKEFPRLERQTRAASRLAYPRDASTTPRNFTAASSRTVLQEVLRLEEPDLDALSDAAYDKLMRRFPVLARALKDGGGNNNNKSKKTSPEAAAACDTVLLRKRNLADADAVKLVAEHVWRSRGTLRSFQCFNTRGLDSHAALAIMHALQQCGELERVEFAGTRVRRSVAAALAVLAERHLPKLHTVSLAHCALYDNCALMWGMALKRGCRSLRQLDLSQCYIGPAGCTAIALGLSDNAALTKLDLSFNDIGRRGVIKLGQALLKNPVLHELVLEGCGSGSRGACSLAAFLMHPRCRLKRLNLANNDIGPRGGGALAVGIASNQSLEELVLSGNDFGDEGSAPFGPCLKRNTCLMVLSMADCDMSDLGAAGIALGLEHNRTLRELDLSEQIISDAGCGQLAMRLGLNSAGSGLQVLKLNGNAIRNDGGSNLAEMLKSPGLQLRELYLVDNEIGDVGAIAMANAIIEAGGEAASPLAGGGRLFSVPNPSSATTSDTPPLQLTSLDMSGNPIRESVATEYFSRAMAASKRTASEFGTEPLVIKADGTNMARGTLRSCGVVSLRTKMQGWYYVALMLVTLGSQWADFLTDVLVAKGQVELSIDTGRAEDIGFAVLTIAFIVIPYFYILVMYSLPEQVDFSDEVFLRDDDDDLAASFTAAAGPTTNAKVKLADAAAVIAPTASNGGGKHKLRSWRDRVRIVLHSRWTWKRAALCLITAVQLRPAYEMYRSIKQELSTMALIGIRLSQTLLESIPQSMIQMHILFSASNLRKLQSYNGRLFSNPDDWSIELLIGSALMTYVLLANTLSQLFEEKDVINWKKVAWAHEEAAYWFATIVAFVYHFAHYIFRSFYIVLITLVYGPVMCLVFLGLGLGSRLALWKASNSARQPLFSVVSFLVGSATWDKRWAARLCQGLELLELGHALALLWIPVEAMPRDVPQVFKYEQWALISTVIGPVALTVVITVAWAVNILLYASFMEQLQSYSDVQRVVQSTVVQRTASEPFTMLAEDVKHTRRKVLGSFESKRTIKTGHLKNALVAHLPHLPLHQPHMYESQRMQVGSARDLVAGEEAEVHFQEHHRRRSSVTDKA